MSDRSARVIEKAREMGADMAGIATVDLVATSPSHQLLREIGTEVDGISFNHYIGWPGEARSALVIAVSHPSGKPELDWWNAVNSPGNRILLRINKELSTWIESEFGIKTHRLNYSTRNCGAYLKDAAVLAGLGCIGRNNLLVTPECGPRVRLRGMLLEGEWAPTGPIDFDPCDGCEEPCREACPQGAYTENVFASVEAEMDALPGRDGRFSRARCLVQMEDDIAHSSTALDEVRDNGDYTEDASQEGDPIKYCRRCEFACPVGAR
jgi:epoxyqueuosine reductase